MSNFALNTTDPYGDVISSINYLLATKGADGANIANVLVANATTGQITTTVDPNFLAYLYQYIDVRYADSADGSVNFSTSPTNRLYFGVRNYQTGGGSSNPADYIWTQVSGGGFGTTNFLYYQTIGGRQIQFFVGTAPPGSTWVITTDAVAIDLDILSASLVNTTLQILYSDGQVFNRNTANVWSPTETANIVSTVANISAIRNNVVVAAIGQTISYNTAAQTWSLSTNPSPNVNGNLFSNGTIVSTASNFYHPVSYVDTYANLIVGESVTVVTSGAAGSNGINGLSASITFDDFSTFIQEADFTWSPPANIAGYITTNVTITITSANTIVGKITRPITFNANSQFVTNSSLQPTGVISNITGWSNSQTISGNAVVSLLGGTPGSLDAQEAKIGNITVTGGNLGPVDVILVGPGASSGYWFGVNQNVYAGGGGQVKTFSNVYLPEGTTSYRVGSANTYATFGMTTYTTSLQLTSGTVTARSGGGPNFTGTQANTGAPGNAGANLGSGLNGGAGIADPWGLINSATRANITFAWGNFPGLSLTNNVTVNTNPLMPTTITHESNHYSGGLAYFGGGGANANVTSLGIGGIGGGSNAAPAGGGFVGWSLQQSGGWGGGGGGLVQGTTGPNSRILSGENGLILIRQTPESLANNFSVYSNIWNINTSSTSITDVNSNSFVYGTTTSNPRNFEIPITYSSNLGNITVSIECSSVPTNRGLQGNRGFIPLAYVVTSSDPTLLSNAQLSSAFAAPRDAIIPPIGTGFAPIEGDTAQFVYTTTPTSIVKTYDGTGWADADGEVIDGNVIVTGTVTASKLAANDIYALTIQSTSATTGSNTSPGFWLEASTGNARFGGGLNVGDELVVGNNAVIGGNLAVTGLITAGNLIANTVNTTTIVPDSVTNSNGVSIAGTVFSDNAVTLANLGLITEGGNTYYLYESDQYYAPLSNVQLIYQDTTVTAGISGQTQVQGNVYADQTFSPFVTSQLYRKDPDGVFTAIAPKNYSLITGLFAGNQNIIASQTINDFYSYTVGIIETFSTNGAAQTHEYGWAYSLGALVSGYEATATGNLRGTNPTVGVTQFKR